MIIETEDLGKTFISKIKGRKKEFIAVKGVNLQVKKGEIFGFLGPNGAGKSTTQKMLSTLLLPTRGCAFIAGHNLFKDQKMIRQKIGYVSQAGGTDCYATGRNNLILQAQLYGLSYSLAKKRAAEFAEHFKMHLFIDRLAGTYSGGQKRRLDLALGMIHHPQLLLLDEPTTGLDPQSRAYLWEEIRNLKAKGTTIFLTTHYMDEADKLCDMITIIDQGTIIRQGTPSELKNSIGTNLIEFGFADNQNAQKAADLIKERGFTAQIKNNLLYLSIKQEEKALPILLRLMETANVSIHNITSSSPSLDDVFLKYTGHSLREEV